MTDTEPVYAQVDRQSKKHTSNMNDLFTHRRYLSACSSSTITDSITSTNNINVDIHSSATLPSHTRRKCYIVFSL